MGEFFRNTSGISVEWYGDWKCHSRFTSEILTNHGIRTVMNQAMEGLL
jgi:hypothetical protein